MILTLISTCIDNPNKAQGGITYPFWNLYRCTICVYTIGDFSLFWILMTGELQRNQQQYFGIFDQKKKKYNTIFVKKNQLIFCQQLVPMEPLLKLLTQWQM